MKYMVRMFYRLSFPTEDPLTEAEISTITTRLLEAGLPPYVKVEFVSIDTDEAA